MRTYGYIYFICDKKTAENAVNNVVFSQNSKDAKARIERIYQNGLKMLYSLQKREPTEFEKESTYRAATERYRQETKKPEIRTVKHLTKITHPTFSIETVSGKAQQISRVYPDMNICSVAGFDESVLQLCIYKAGNVITVHQIGDELGDMGMDLRKGEVKPISSFFCVSEDSVCQFLSIEDVIDAEEYLFSELIGT